MNTLLINAVGVGAAACSMASFLPQAIKIWREKDASSVSLGMYLVTAAGFSLWTVYGFMLKSWPLVGSNLVCLALSLTVMGLKLRYGEGPPRSEAAEGSAPPTRG